MNKWLPYNGEYEKQFYDVRLKDGREYLKCWPNAGIFNCTKGDGAGEQIHESFVKDVRLSKN